MPIIRCSAQKSQTLEEFYTEFISKSEDKFEDIGTSMLKVLELFNRIFKETTIFGLTSHATLLLFEEDDYTSDWFVAINGFRGTFYIEYMIPKEKSPWENAIVKGATNSLEEFEEMIIISMKESTGWKGNVEIDNLYQKLKK
ncbi:hypothetical protein A0O34_20240 [Chryseobacterium glaciei]|uniref:Uncharacterized protein n=1 Tax=Chryseobacterium glaciei TaxID=1685010 RepID=A0A172Y0N1_9FLAO|nr:hypothetical protein A0O34_20240 [Chryseobacterium glaciei]